MQSYASLNVEKMGGAQRGSLREEIIRGRGQSTNAGNEKKNRGFDYQSWEDVPVS
jgi:hypothetical protein